MHAHCSALTRLVVTKLPVIAYNYFQKMIIIFSTLVKPLLGFITCTISHMYICTCTFITFYFLGKAQLCLYKPEPLITHSFYDLYIYPRSHVIRYYHI